MSLIVSFKLFCSTFDVCIDTGEPAYGPTHSFVFGSSEISSLSFGALAESLNSNQGFAKSSQGKGFNGAGAQLFGGSKSDRLEENDEGYDPESEVSDVHFQPIVHLPVQTEHTTGEENEEIVYCERVKLYRFAKDVSQWKERGVGNLKLLRHKTTGQVRLLMRRDKIFKLCANHLLTPDMELKPNASSDRSWMWHTNADISDGKAKAEQLAARFKDAKMANQFKEKFEFCREQLLTSATKKKDEGKRTDDQETVDNSEPENR